MANFFIIDSSGQKHGAFTPQQLQALATQGKINPQTPLESDTGHKGTAGQIPGLFVAVSSPFAQPPILSTPPVQYAPTNPLSNPLPMILFVGLLVVGTICFGVGSYAILWGMTRTPENTIISMGAYSEERAKKMVKSAANEAYGAGTVFLVIAGGAFTGAYVVFIRLVKRKQE